MSHRSFPPHTLEPARCTITCMARRFLALSLVFALTVGAPSAAAEGNGEGGSALSPDASFVRLRVRPERGRYGEYNPRATLFDVGTGVALCPLPCDVRLDPQHTYRIGGGVRESAPFTVPPGGAFAVTAISESTAHAVGALVLAAGALVLGASLFELAVEHGSSRPGMYGAIAGAGMALGGGAAWVLYAPTTVETHPLVQF